MPILTFQSSRSSIRVSARHDAALTEAPCPMSFAQPEQGRVHALAERLKGIRRFAPADHRWSLHGLTYKDAARVVIGVQDAIEELCFAAKN